MIVKNPREFRFQNYYKRIGFTTEDSYCLLKINRKKI